MLQLKERFSSKVRDQVNGDVCMYFFLLVSTSELELHNPEPLHFIL